MLGTRDAVPTLLELVVVGVPVWQGEEDMEVVVVIVLVRVKAEVVETTADLEGKFEGEREGVKVAETVPETEMMGDAETRVVEVEEGVTATGEKVAERVAVTVVEKQK